MSINAIGNSTPNYAPQKSGEDNAAALESKLDALNNQLRQIKQDEKLAPEKKKKQIEDIENKIAKIKQMISQMKKDNETNKEQPVKEQSIKDIDKQNLSKEKPSKNNLIDEYV